MSNTFTVITELHPDDRKRLDELIAFAGLIVGEMKAANAPVIMKKDAAPAEESTAPQEAPNLEVVKSDHPVDAVPPHAEPQDVAPAEAPKPTVTLDQIRKKVTTLRASSDKAKKEGAKDIVMAYAPNISGLENCKDKWPEIWDKLTALEG